MKPRPSETSEHDPTLATLGFAGDSLIYTARLARMAQLHLEGKGPRAYLDRLLASLDYHSPWRPLSLSEHESREAERAARQRQRGRRP